MLDTYIVNPTRHSTKTVIEKRAPTDESVKLLQEMQEKALKEIIGRIQVQQNGFEVVAYAFQDVAAFAKRVYLKYTLGTKEYVLNVTLRQTATVREIANKLVDELARDIAKNILEEALKPNVVKELIGGL